MLRVLVVVALVGCGQKTVPPVMGTSQANAIAVPLSEKPDQVQPALTGFLDPIIASRDPRWFVLNLPATEKRTLSLTVLYGGAANSVDMELVDPAGHVVAHADAGTYGQYERSGSRSVWRGEIQGTHFVRVTTRDGATDYTLNVSSSVVTPRPKEWDPCNAYVYDPQNPRCKGIVACDPNKPVTTNPACCSKRCIRGWCSGTLSRFTADDGYAWFSLGANAGITTWYDGEADLTVVGGASVPVRLRVVEVERERSKVWLSVYERLDLTRLDGRLARLQTPAVCGTDDE